MENSGNQTEQISVNSKIDINPPDNTIHSLDKSNSLGDNSTIPNPTKPLSKNQLKKMKKQAEWDSKKKEYRKKQKIKKKEKKQKEREEAKKHGGQSNNVVENKPAAVMSRKEREEIYLNKIKEGIRVVLDCDFENLMNDKDAGSLTRQIAYCYSVNRKAEKPLNFLIYDAGPIIQSHLNKMNFDNWSGVGLVKKGEYKDIHDYLRKSTNSDFKKENIVYLTADSENEITELKPEEVYLIGGIVDRNRYKLITLNKAKELGIRHAKLPIGEYIQMNSCKVLTTNHVFQILSHYVNEQQGWKEAFMSIIPKRKLNE